MGFYEEKKEKQKTPNQARHHHSPPKKTQNTTFEKSLEGSVENQHFVQPCGDKSLKKFLKNQSTQTVINWVRLAHFGEYVYLITIPAKQPAEYGSCLDSCLGEFPLPISSGFCLT